MGLFECYKCAVNVARRISSSEVGHPLPIDQIELDSLERRMPLELLRIWLGIISAHNSQPSGHPSSAHRKVCDNTTWLIRTQIVSAGHEFSKMFFRADKKMIGNQLITQAKQSKMPSMLGPSGRVLRREMSRSTSAQQRIGIL